MLGSKSWTLSPVTLDFITSDKLLGEHDKRRERARSLDYESSLLINMRTANIDNVLGQAPNSGIQVKGCFSLLHVPRESLKEVVQSQIEDHCSPLPHTSWPKIGGELVKNINKGGEIQKDRKDVTIKQKLETGTS